MTAPIQPAPGAPAPAPQPQPGPAPAPAPTAPAPWSPDSLPPEARTWLDAQVAAADKKARLTTQQNAAQQAEQSLTQKLAELLGFADPAAPTTVEGLTARLGEVTESAAEATARAESAEMEATVVRAASRLGVNAERILDSKAWVEKINNIEADTEEAWKAALDKLIADAVIADASLKLGGLAPARQGTDVSGGTTGARPTSLGAAIGNRLRA